MHNLTNASKKRGSSIAQIEKEKVGERKKTGEKERKKAPEEIERVLLRTWLFWPICSPVVPFCCREI